MTNLIKDSEKVFIARDKDGDIYLYNKKPEFIDRPDEDDYYFYLFGREANSFVLPSKLFSEVKTGQCYELKLNLRKKVFDKNE